MLILPSKKFRKQIDSVELNKHTEQPILTVQTLRTILCKIKEKVNHIRGKYTAAVMNHDSHHLNKNKKNDEQEVYTTI